MKYEGLTQEFVNLVDDYKIDKFDKLINGDAKNIKGFIKSLIKMNDDLERQFLNILTPIDIESFCHRLKESIVIDENLLEKELSVLIEEWRKIQNQDDYKVQTLRTKLVNGAFKSLKIISHYDEKKLKAVINQALDYSLLAFDLESKLNSLIDLLNDRLDSDAKEKLETQKQKWQKELQDITEKYDYANWLDWAAENAKSISFSTHPIKLTHSSISGASNIYDYIQSRNNEYITTSSLTEKPIDIGSSNNALAPIGKLLELNFHDIELATQLSQNDVSVFEQFAKNEQQLKKWQDGFSESFKNSNPSSHSLAKQIYFPIQGNYHLISPLVSSSMTHVLFNKIRQINFDTESIEIRGAKSKNLYHSKTNVSYPNIAIRMVTASQHGNASPLNGKRSGQSNLFPSIPPQWQSQIKPPIKGKSLFSHAKQSIDFKAINELRDLLVAIKLNELSFNMERKQLIQNHINVIVDSLFDYVTQIHNLTEQAGWSQYSELRQSHQFWLDPYRQDDKFQKQRQETNWKNEICQDFSFWLNKQLKHKQLTLGKHQADYWGKLFKPQLREFEAITEAKEND